MYLLSGIALILYLIPAKKSRAQLGVSIAKIVILRPCLTYNKAEVKHMKRLILLLAIPALFSCSAQPVSSEETSLLSTEPLVQESQPPANEVADSRSPINFKRQTGRWLSYLEYPELMTGRSAEQFRSAVRDRFSQAAEDGVNTVYVHVRPTGDAYYSSSLFPPGAALDGEYDPLKIMVDEAHSLGLSIHAWINPLRLQTEEDMKNIPESYITRQWADQQKYARLVNGRWYLVPAYKEVRELINREVSEILDNYSVDGIHIDDYFYPTVSPDFDGEAFAASGSSDLDKWRLSNITEMVKGIYDTVKAGDDRILFGISPQGSIPANYDSQYADVRLWAGQKGYCDYILPQIYFGFRNETAPFEKTLREWEDIRGSSGVSLIIGLAGYKTGKEDQWAGDAGELEWIEDADIIEKQINAVENSSADGYSVYY